MSTEPSGRLLAAPSGRLHFRNEYGLLLATLVVVVVTALVNRSYIEKPGPNATEILRQTALLGVFALGAAVVIISGGIDLSAGSVITFAGSICAQVIVLLAPVDSRGIPDTTNLTLGVVAAGIAAALVAGFLVGTLHTWLITIIGLPPFVATLASLVGLRSLAKVMNQEVTRSLGNQSTKININDLDFSQLGKTWWIPVLIFLVLSALVWLLLNRTVAGRHIYALGGNEQAARLSGIRTDRLKWLAYSLSAMTAAIAGVLYTAEVGSADPQTQGRGYELNAIAASVVGGCSLQGGIGTVSGVMLGVLFLRVVIDSVAKLVGAGSDDYEGIIVGFLVVLAVAFNQLRSSRGLGLRLFPGVFGAFSIAALSLLGALVLAIVAGRWVGVGVGLAALVAMSLVKTWEAARERRLRTML